MKAVRRERGDRSGNGDTAIIFNALTSEIVATGVNHRPPSGLTKCGEDVCGCRLSGIISAEQDAINELARMGRMREAPHLEIFSVRIKAGYVMVRGIFSYEDVAPQLLDLGFCGIWTFEWRGWIFHESMDLYELIFGGSASKSKDLVKIC